jgi:hypothetical protein
VVAQAITLLSFWRAVRTMPVMRVAIAPLLLVCASLAHADVPLESKASIYGASTTRPTTSPTTLQRGPHLLLDDELIETSHNLRRVVNRPSRDVAHANPIITGKEDGCFQPYMSVLRDDTIGRFRIWYGARKEDRDEGQSRLAYMESDDGIAWRRPHRLLETPPIQFGASVLRDDSGYKFAWWAPAVPKDAPPGMKVASSPDGLRWERMTTPGAASDVVLPHSHDINGIFRDPIRNRYIAIASTYVEDPAWTGKRRVTTQAVGDDLLHWSKPWRVLVPDPTIEDEQTQFYAMDGFLTRGELLIGMVKVLRDDLKADDPPNPPDAYGIGYTTLAWSRDGEHWIRDREPFLDRDPRQGAWDHAHAWIDEQLPVGEDVYLYYAGYARGHKVNRFEERQIGLLKMKRDRYVAREANATGGTFTTPPLKLDGNEITLNVDAAHGEVRVQVLDETGKVLPGFAFADCEPIRADALAASAKWKGGNLLRTPLRLEFAMKDARLFAIELR